MAAMQGALSASERSMRSVFVGNIPYEATEEQLKDIFCEVGPVVSFRLVYDRETGKPKGYGFCEYKDQEMALSAMRNLSGYELNGRALRVDNAASEKSKEELKNLQASLGGPPVESPYGAEVPPDQAPEVISRIMASLPPEQLHEFMLQMKMCIENNPNEARNLLIQNPQLTYALLQAQVLMKIISPQTAASMLHGPNGSPVRFVPDVTPSPLLPNSQAPLSLNQVSHIFPSGSSPVSMNPSVNDPRTMAMPMPSRSSMPMPSGSSMPMPSGSSMPMPSRSSMPMPSRSSMPMPSRSSMLMPPPMAPPSAPVMRNSFSGRDPRMADHDLRPQHHIDHDMRRTFTDPRYQNPPAPDIRSHQGVSFDRPRTGQPPDRRTGYDVRSVSGMSPRMDDPRSANIARASNISPGHRTPVQHPRIDSTSAGPSVGSASPQSSLRPGSNQLAAAVSALSPNDQERASLIMQVLKLTDQQVALLPPEQRQSIMILKQQIARK